MENISIKQVEENGKGRFIVYYKDTEAGYIKYEWLPNGNLLANGTLVYDDFRSYRLGQPLFDALLQLAREKATKIYPTCPFVVKMMRRDSSVHDLLADDYLHEHPELKK